MNPPNDVALDGSSSEDVMLDKTEYTDSLLAELDGMEDTGRAPDDLLADDSPPSDSPADDTKASPTESQSDAPAPEAIAPPDPFRELTKDATPITYTVDGHERSFDGIVITKNGAGYIPTESVERLRNTLGLAEKSIADNKGLYERTQAYERLGGTQKLSELSEQVAQLDAAGTKLLALLEDPTQLLMLDEQGNVVKNPRAIEMLTRDLQLSSKEAGWQARQSLQQQSQQYQQTATQGQQQAQAMENIYGQFHAQYPNLTPQDLVAAKAHFGQFAGALFRQATPDDAQRYGYRIGELLIDTPKMVSWFEDRASLRASKSSEDTARKKAEDENRKRQAPSPVVSPRSAKAKAQPRQSDGTFAEKAAERERVKRAMNAAHRRGEFYEETRSNDV